MDDKTKKMGDKIETICREVCGLLGKKRITVKFQKEVPLYNVALKMKKNTLFILPTIFM
jgi:hypothetical protein